MKMTVGVDFSVKQLDWDDHTRLRLQFWDIAGQERFGHMTPMYFREAVGAFVVYDVTDPKSFEMVPQWKESLDANLSDDSFRLPVVLLGNKCDIDHETDSDMLDAFCKEKGFLCWFETSALNGTNINEAVNALVKEIMNNELPTQVIPKADVVDLAGGSSQQKEQRSRCPCS